jgi:hypothetical protein
MIYELRGALDDEEDDAVRDDIRRVLRMLSGRPDLTHRSATEVNALLQTPPYSLPPPVPSALPPFAPYEEPPPGRPKGGRTQTALVAAQAMSRPDPQLTS